MRNKIKKIFFITLMTFFLLSTNAIAIKQTKTSDENYVDNQYFDSETLNKIISQSNEDSDLDPLVDLEVSVIIKEIRGFDKIDLFSDPDFYVKVLFEDGKEYTSPVWENKNHVVEEWVVTQDVPDNNEWVNITIQLWDKDPISDKLCDISVNNNYGLIQRDINVMYNLKTGHWYSYGDDMITPPDSWTVDYSGYGRANGCDDNSIYENDLDCELFFDIIQNDFDGDGIPYWTEVNIFETDPEVDDTGRDDDSDDVPIEWEYKWGNRLDYVFVNDTLEFEFLWEYDPFEYNDHKNLDPDEDSLNNYEEYLVSEWGSDPFRKDIFVELDKMDAGPNGEPKSDLPNESRELIYMAFNKQNIVFHLDDGEMGGGEVIPFDNEGEETNRTEINEIYNDYFLHGDEDNWRKGVFHYGLMLYNSVGVSGYMFRNNAFQVSSKGLDKKSTQIGSRDRDVVYVSAYMHELGHTLGLTWLGGHYQQGKYFWQIGWWRWRPYKSIMNYGYMYGFIHDLVDFSDGSRGKNDFDDWNNIDFDYFEQ